MEKNIKGKCGVCEIPHFERNNYYYGKLMTARDFKDEQCYFNEKRWLINRMINGWGVVCGLDVHFEDSDDGEECIQEKSTCRKESECKIVIEPGLAIDCCGREILVCEQQTITLAEVEKRCTPKSDDHDPGEEKYVLCLEYHECETEAVAIAPSMCSQSEKKAYNRIRDFFKIRLRYASDVKIQDYQRDFCQLSDRRYVGQVQPDSESGQEQKPGCGQYETLNQYLCEKLREGCPDCAHGSCLLLADISAEQLNGSADDSFQDPKQQEQHQDTEQQEPQEESPKTRIKIRIDPCSRRRLLYNNKMLFDLIHCYHDDLPHVVGINWGSLLPDSNNYKDHEVWWDDFKKVAKEGFKVRFDRPMDPGTINKHTFLVGIYAGELATGWLVKNYIPAERIDYYPDTCEAHFVIYNEEAEKPKEGERLTTFWGEEFTAQKSKFRYRDGTNVEIVLRGSLICDIDGKALDGEFIANRLPSGNGVQGGDFISCFKVKSMNDQKQSDKPKQEDDFYKV